MQRIWLRSPSSWDSGAGIQHTRSGSVTWRATNVTANKSCKGQSGAICAPPVCTLTWDVCKGPGQRGLRLHLSRVTCCPGGLHSVVLLFVRMSDCFASFQGAGTYNCLENFKQFQMMLHLLIAHFISHCVRPSLFPHLLSLCVPLHY